MLNQRQNLWVQKIGWDFNTFAGNGKRKEQTRPGAI
jgi:hypothetical protein